MFEESSRVIRRRESNHGRASDLKKEGNWDFYTWGRLRFSVSNAGPVRSNTDHFGLVIPADAG